MVTIPTWAIQSTPEYCSRYYYTDEEMMSLAIHLSDKNITEGTGGPFGACIFERHGPTESQPNGYCTLVSIGMNRVVPLENSTLHGEMVAIQLAQRKLGSFTLQLEKDSDSKNDGSGSDGLFYDESKDEDEIQAANSTTASGNTHGEEKGESSEQTKRQFELFTSCEPCAMCLGGTLWSGVSRLVRGAKKADAQAIGFDEGPVYEQSYQHLEEHGVQVTRGVLTEEAAKVLRRYGEIGLIYNR